MSWNGRMIGMYHTSTYNS